MIGAGWIQRLSYRYKIVLAVSLPILLTVTFLSALFLWHSYSALKAYRIQGRREISALLATDLSAPLVNDNLWEVYEIIYRLRWAAAQTAADEVTVLDARQHIYITTRVPVRHFLLKPLSALGVPYTLLPVDLAQQSRTGSIFEHAQDIIAATPIIEDGVVIGTVLVKHSLQPLQTQLRGLIWHTLEYGSLLLLLLAVLSWRLGTRVIRPVLQLRDCVARVNSMGLEVVRCELTERDDELGELARGFEEMLCGIREKKLLEKRMMRAERLAALGRFAAGIAHEINNPLGGMLNAINTYKRHGGDGRVASKTMDLLERGLGQIRQTVQALLIEVRIEDRPISRADLNDVRILVQGEVAKKRLRLDWHCKIQPQIALPSSQVRQILINLVLNAIHAVDEGGWIGVECKQLGQALRLQVEDNGHGLPAELRDHLFEPFLIEAQGNGLGLWITYRIVQHLQGQIEFVDGHPGTCVQVLLPVPTPSSQDDAAA